MRLIIQKIADWTGKVVIPTDEIMKEKITIYAPGRLPRKEALEQIYGALRIKGYAPEFVEKTIYLKRIRDARIGTVPILSADQPLAAVENKDQIVQKSFRVTNSGLSQMVQTIQPLIGENGHISTDEPTSTLLVIDTVRNLMRIETMIAQCDVPGAQPSTTEVFEVRNRAPGEIVQLLQLLLGGSRGPGGGGFRTGPDSGFGEFRGRGRGGFASSSVVSGTRGPMVLIAEPKFNWVIAKAAAEDMQEIRKWIERLDKPEPTVVAGDSLDKMENRNQVVQRFLKLAHSNPDRMSSILTPMLGPSGRILPEQTTSTLMIIDTVENLIRIEKVVAQFDVPPREDIVTQVFELQHREPEEITNLLSSILGEGVGSSMSSVGREGYRGPSWATRVIRVDRARFKSSRSSGGPAGGDQPVVFIPEPRRKWIIVKARPEDLEAITTWIKRLDQPMPTIAAGDSLDTIENKTQIVQRFFKLAHYSADRMAEILMPMLGTSGRILPEQNTNTLLMIDTVENLQRAEEIIAQFDVQPQENVVTQVFELQYREPDEVASLLSAILGDNTGASTSTYGRDRSTSNWSVRAIRVDRSKFRTNNRPWTPNAVNEQSALFVPEPHRKWIIVKARPEDIESITAWIKKLDKPIQTIAADDSLDKIENKKDVVQRFMKLKHCSVDRMVTIITPLLGDTARVMPEPTTGTLMVVDTVENLLRIEKIVAEFDVPQRDDTITQVFELQYREPEEIANLLGAVVGDSSLSTASTSLTGQYRQNWDWAGRAMRLGRFRSGGSSRTSSNPVAAGSAEQPMLFIPEPHRKWIIVKARQEDMTLIEGWIKRLDQPMPTVTADQPLTQFQNKNQVVQRFVKLEHCDPVRMSDIITPLLTENGHVTAEEGTATLLLIDTVENLLRIEAVIAQFDTAEADIATEIFEVRQRSPEEVITLLETILSDRSGAGTSGYGRPGQSRSRRPGSGSYTRFTGSAANGASLPIVGPGGRTIVLTPETKQGWIIAKAAPADITEIRKWIERLDRPVATITSDTPLATIENKNQVIQRCIKLHSYSASQMGEIVLPLLSESGYVSADETTGNLLLIDTVENLMKIEAIVAQFDVPGAEKTTTQVFEVAHADPAEVVQVLRMLLSDTAGRPGGGYGGYGGGYGGYGRSYGGSRGYSSGSRLYRGGFSGSSANSVIMGPSQLPVVLIPEPKRKWIIARASAEDMKLVGEWIQKLDQGEPAGREYETVPITYADVREVATRINEALQQMPGTELQASVLVQALEQARQVMVFGRADLREMVKKMVEEIDVPPGQFETRHFQIQHADPDQIKRNIDELFGEGAMVSRTSSYRSYGGYSGRSGAGLSPDTVKTIAHVSLKQVTVIASPENMKKIADQIEQWDVAVDVNEVRPRIIELRNSDPRQMSTLLKTLFSQQMNSQYSFLSYLFGSGSQDKQRIVGPLYGQVTFEEVVGTKKLIVISNVPGAYGVVEDLIKELDSREAAEVPKVVRLNYADPERLAQRLNAMFNEAGTSASISLTQRGLSEYSMDEGSSSSSGNNNARGGAANTSVYNPAPAGEYRPWWTTGARGTTTQMPISNIIGRARFIPDTYSKSLLVLAPPEFMESLETTIAELDVPGKQLMLKAIIMQVDHQNMTSLGVQYSSDPTRWNPPDNENALVARNTFSALQTQGSLVINPTTGVATTGTGIIIQEGLNLNILIDFLMRDLHAKILNQQTLWTKDNEEAQFFKGQRVGFQTQISISDTGGRATSNFTYEKVGMTLRARPSITPEKNVDMIINVILSQLEPELINTQPVRTELDTTTNLVVKDGQTIMLGGMLFQEDSQANRKVPILGDLPVVGWLFRHKQDRQANSELLIFITPYVIETGEQMLPEARQEQTEAQQRLRRVQRDFKALAEEMAPPADGDSPDVPAPASTPDANEPVPDTE
jgi:general secretion pathway protein D